jgi:hypothetical protein
MKFFIPVQDARIGEESYQSIKNFIEKQTGWPISDMRYYEIHYRHNDQDLSARVGGPDPLNGEKSSPYSNLKTQSARFSCALTVAALCKANQFWLVMTRRRSSLSEKISSTNDKKSPALRPGRVCRRMGYWTGAAVSTM